MPLLVMCVAMFIWHGVTIPKLRACGIPNHYPLIPSQPMLCVPF